MAGNGRHPEGTRAKHEITSKQSKAIVALLSTKSVAEAAKVAKVGERTLWRWLADPAFRLHLADAEGDMIDQATRRLIALTDHALTVITITLADKQIHPALRLRAAQSVLDYLLKLRELRNIEARLLALEMAYANKTG